LGKGKQCTVSIFGLQGPSRRIPENWNHKTARLKSCSFVEKIGKLNTLLPDREEKTTIKYPKM
jgi:hypothetical protein